MMCSDPRRSLMASGRSRPCVSEMTPIRMADLRSQFSVLGTRYSFLHLLDELADAHDGPAHGAAADFLNLVARGHAQGVEAAVKRLERRLGLDVRANTARRAVLDVDGSPH